MASKRNKSYKFYILTLCILFVAVYFGYNIISLVVKPTEVFLIQEDDLTEEEAVVGYIIREENIVTNTEAGNDVIQIKTEGEKVAKGDIIYRYVNENHGELDSQVSELSVKIQEALESQRSKYSSDIKTLNNQIEENINNLKYENNIQKIAELKKDIDTSIEKKVNIIGENSNTGSYIKDLINERAGLMKRLEDETKYEVATQGGVISYRVDDLESILTPTNFTIVTEDFLEDLNIKTGQIVGSTSGKCKVVNNYFCDIAINVNSKNVEDLKIGNKIKVRLSNGKEVMAKVEYLTDNILIIRIEECVEELIAYRKISLDIIWWKKTGLKVPKSAILYDNGLAYVEKNQAGYKSRVLVKIIKENETYCIIDSYSTDELIELGYNVEEIRGMRKIHEYDEINTNPEVQ